MPVKVAFHTLGCKVNYYETEALKGKFKEDGFMIVDFQEPADVYIINTCTVTHLADRKSRQIIRRAKRRNPEALVAVTGCYAQVNRDDIASLPEVDLLLGTDDRFLLPGLVKRKLAGAELLSPVGSQKKQVVFEDMPWIPEQGRTRAFLKIQDGCNQFCTYCIVPLARGPLRSLSPSKALEYLQEISSSGYKEVVLTGIHLGLYGVDLKPATNLASFLKRAVLVEGIKRLRLSSIEPSDFSPDLIAVIQENEKICRHLHIPLQSGDNTILKKMGRPYDTVFFEGLLQRLKEAIPDLAVSTDLIVGFPGEEDEHFRQSLDFVRQCAFSRLHVFKFSPRPGTKAALMKPQVDSRIKDKRSREMIALGEELSAVFQGRFVGQSLSVLFEKSVVGDGEDAILEGLTSHYLRVRAPGPSRWRGLLKDVFIEKNSRDYLEGRITEDKQQ